MRVLVVHNRYSSQKPSGENLAVRDEMAWLQEAGVEVVPHEADNDKVFATTPRQKLRQAGEAVWSVSENRRLERAIRRNAPDIVHVHNLFPLLSASVPWRALREDVPVVWTVHNHRVRCVIGTHFRDGQPCHQCRAGWRLPGIVHSCYGDSRLASTLVTLSSSLFGAIARRRVTALTISDALRDWLLGPGGFRPERVVTKYNGVAAPPPELTLADPAASRTFLFAGVVSEHKGIPLLLDAWQRADLPGDVELQVIGEGPLVGEVEALATRDPRVRWLGQLPATEVQARMATARAVVVPSTWQEPFGRVAAEALACGRPVVTTGNGGLREIVTEATGWVTGTDPAALAEVLTTVAGADSEVSLRGKAAARRHETEFSPEATTRTLLGVYEQVLAAT